MEIDKRDAVEMDEGRCGNGQGRKLEGVFVGASRNVFRLCYGGTVSPRVLLGASSFEFDFEMVTNTYFWLAV